MYYLLSAFIHQVTIRGSTKVIYTKYSKHCPYTVAHTIECVCSKINHGLNHGLFISLLKQVLFELFGALYMYISEKMVNCYAQNWESKSSPPTPTHQHQHHRLQLPPVRPCYLGRIFNLLFHGNWVLTL